METDRNTAYGLPSTTLESTAHGTQSNLKVGQKLPWFVMHLLHLLHLLHLFVTFIASWTILDCHPTTLIRASINSVHSIQPP